MARYLLHIILLLSLLACQKSGETNQCYTYKECLDKEGRFCTNGFKFGEKVRYDSYGVDTPGPSTAGNVVTYSFQSQGATYTASIHGAFRSRPFDEIGDFAQAKIIEAIDEWGSHINLDFRPALNEVNSDLKIICTSINDTKGLGITSCTTADCTALEAYVFFDNSPISAENFYSLALHELGHVLGLSDSNRSNIMSYESNIYEYNTLQAGDIEGVISIYGPR